MKTRYKFLFVIFLLILGMSYESARNQEVTQEVQGRPSTALDEQIKLYEARLADGSHFDERNDRGPAPTQNSGQTGQGNLIARTGRNIGHAMQTFVREMLRGVVRFFDGIIS